MSITDILQGLQKPGPIKSFITTTRYLGNDGYHVKPKYYQDSAKTVIIPAHAYIIGVVTPHLDKFMEIFPAYSPSNPDKIQIHRGLKFSTFTYFIDIPGASDEILKDSSQHHTLIEAVENKMTKQAGELKPALRQMRNYHQKITDIADLRLPVSSGFWMNIPREITEDLKIAAAKKEAFENAALLRDILALPLPGSLL